MLQPGLRLQIALLHFEAFIKVAQLGVGQHVVYGNSHLLGEVIEYDRENGEILGDCV